MATRSVPAVDGDSAAAVERDVDENPGVVAVSGADMFFSSRKVRRVQLPASLRQGRHGATDGRKARRATNGRATAPQPLYLIDADGHTETSRIALRRRFEEMSAAESSSDADSPLELEQSVAG